MRDLPCRFMNAPDDILCMFDKMETHRCCQAAAIPVPASLNPVQNSEELIAAMTATGWNRVFIKANHGSSASGVGAFYRSKDGNMRLVTTTEMVDDSESLKLYNSLKIRTYTNHKDITLLIDEWCRHRVHVEKWLPKAGQDGYPCDLRIVVIGGEPAHTVVRLGLRSPITNLHLGNRRGDFEQLTGTMGTERLDEIHETCRRIARLFSASHVIVVDLLLTPQFRNHYVLELNAVGDLLPGLLFCGYETCGWEILKWFGGG
jgi:glutathione synthase/RimK-type ligase-like ATP-grasp enzyme